MNEKPSFYSIIPATVRYCKGLKPNAKLLYGEITALCSDQGFCWANNHYFAELYEVKKETVSRWISLLEEKSFITTEVDQSRGNKRKIFLADASIQKSQEVLTKKSRPYRLKSQDPIDKKVKHSITINNTNSNKESSDLALDFLKLNFPSRFEAFEIQNKALIKDFKKFCLDFNDTCEQEQLDFNDRVLFGRLGKYARNWIENQNRYQEKEPDMKPLYLRKVL